VLNSFTSTLLRRPPRPVQLPQRFCQRNATEDLLLDASMACGEINVFDTI